MRGKFVTFEGCEGCGKSTQLRFVCGWLDELGADYVLTREPGGCPTAEAIRGIILSTEYREMDARCEALLYAAARMQNVREIVEPALAAGKTVLCDRYVDSSLAYQGYARGLGLDFVSGINSYALEACPPDLTLFLDLDPAAAFERKHGADTGDRMEAEGIEFHKKVYEGYHVLMGMYPRIRAVDCTGRKDETFAKIRGILVSEGIVRG